MSRSDGELSAARRKRDFIADYFGRQALGPLGGESEEFQSDPGKFYITGILFPAKDNEDAAYISSEEATGSSEDDESVAERVSVLAGRIQPSSVGLIVRLDPGHETVAITVRYALYERPRQGQKWIRRPASESLEISAKTQDGARDRRLKVGPGYIRTILRSVPGGRRLTVFLVNDGVEASGPTGEKPTRQCLFQPEVSVQILGEGRGFQPFERALPIEAPLEDRIAELQHRHHKVFGASLGSSCAWTVDDSQRCVGVQTTYLPRHEIPPLDFEIDGFRNVLSLKKLGFDMEDEPEPLVRGLYGFVEAYSDWIKSLPRSNPDVAASTEGSAVLALCSEAAERMAAGIRLLETDPLAMRAFVLANRAMLMQAASRKGLARPGVPGAFERPYQDLPDNAFEWRPFQLAFLLLSMEPAGDPSSRYRSVVDLIWFPTGGGKTEAYLGVSAFSILLDRLRSPGRARGTCVISRYTMRLLTAQQFERTAALVVAMELLRRQDPGGLGSDRISLGLWLGAGMTPNHIQGTPDNPGAAELLNRLLEVHNPREENPFKLADCPACRHPLLPAVRSERRDVYGFQIEGNRLVMRCPDSGCPMSEGIPVSVVDDQIYSELPTILIGTIDKFARLAWLEEAGWLLNGRAGAYPPPFLIIQDELHLISGPLGSLAGVYETAIEALCSSDGARPHIIASTATVRRADEQARALYGRHVRQFPPPGLDEADSFFARKSRSADGRLYLGILAPHVTPTTAAVRIHAILLQAYTEASRAGFHEPSDAYSTLVSYFNSRKELGQATTLAADDIPDRLQVLCPDRSRRRRLLGRDFVDLYSERRGPELSDILQRLEMESGKNRALALLLTTNIISVGVSIDRLALMLVNGQPKLTSEYIQATSRVGRSRNAPGLVVSAYSATKPRDRSHYEQFVRYHSRLYASVEPTSVTPYSKPARDRVLHSVAVILARHLPGGLPGNAQARQILQRGDLVSRIEKIVLERVAVSAPVEESATLGDLRMRMRQWADWAQSGELRYESGTRQLSSLLNRNFGSDVFSDGWPTMDSMRNVDFETGIMIVGQPR